MARVQPSNFSDSRIRKLLSEKFMLEKLYHLLVILNAGEDETQITETCVCVKQHSK